MSFCTVINCMDGRVQLPVNNYLQKRFNAGYVDTITEAGPNRILAERQNTHVVQSILKRLNISIEAHGAVGVAMVGHHDCAGNPADKDVQIRHIRQAIRFLQSQYEHVEMIGLWVNEQWQVQEITID